MHSRWENVTFSFYDTELTSENFVILSVFVSFSFLIIYVSGQVLWSTHGLNFVSLVAVKGNPGRAEAAKRDLCAPVKQVVVLVI